MSDQRRRRFTIAIIGLIGVTAGIAGANSLKAGLNRQLIAKYIHTHDVRKLQLGAGDSVRSKEFSDWLNTDIEPEPNEAYLDATKPFPIPDSVLSIIYSEHVFEHLSYSEGLAMLRESHRTLKPGGKIRIATPNVLKFIQLFQEAKTDETQNYIHAKLRAAYWRQPLPQNISPECAILNAELTDFGHKFVYDPKTLRESLERTGFVEIKQFDAGESDDPQLRGLEMRHKSSGHEINDYETMVFQAVRPN